MRYRVAFAKKFELDGREAPMEPSLALDTLLPDGVVAEKQLVERLPPLAQHSQGVLDEDDAFLGSAAPEIWEYEVVNERATEFEEAIQRSRRVFEYDIVDPTGTDPDEIVDDLSGDMPGGARARVREASGPDRKKR